MNPSTIVSLNRFPTPVSIYLQYECRRFKTFSKVVLNASRRKCFKLKGGDIGTFNHHSVGGLMEVHFEINFLKVEEL